MKIVKVLFIFALVSMITVSCKETKKEEVQDDTSVEMTEEGSEAGGMDATEDDVSSDNAAAGAGAVGAAGAAGTAAGEGAEATMEAAEGIEAESKEVEALVVPEGVISEELADTPVIYPGCTGSVEEIRACNKESFVAYIKSEFNHEIGKEAGLKKGDYEIGVVIHVNKAGRVFSLRVTAPDPALKTEMERVVNSTPHVVPATEAGQPVGVSVKFLVDFKLEKL